MRMALKLCAFIMIIFCVSNFWTSAQTTYPNLVYVNTLSNVDGNIVDISADGRYLVVGDTEMSLIDLSSNTTIVRADSLWMNPNGTHAIASDGANANRLIELATGNVIYETPYTLSFPHLGHPFAVVVSFTKSQSILIDLTSGEVVLTADGFVNAISFDNRLVVIRVVIDSTERYEIVDIASQTTLFTIVSPEPFPGEGYLPICGGLFSRDNTILTICTYPYQTLVIDVETGEIKYTVPGAVSLTRDSQYLLNNSDDAFGHVVLIDLPTGEVLYEVDGGALYLSPSQKYLLRKQGYDWSDWQFIDLETGEVVHEDQGFYNIRFLSAGDYVAMYSIFDQITSIYDLSNGRLLRQLDKGYQLTHPTCDSFYILNSESEFGRMMLLDNNFATLIPSDMHTIKASSDCSTIFVQDDDAIQIYRVET